MHIVSTLYGSQAWNFSIGKTSGVTFSPILADGYVYVGASIVTGDSSNYFSGTFPSSQVVGIVYCLNVTTGVQTWNYSTPSNSFVILSPAVGNEEIYVVSGNPAPANICALDARSGAIIWNSTLAGSTEPVDSSAPVVDGNAIYVGLGNFVFALDASSGRQLWNYTAGVRVGSVEVSGKDVYVGSGSPLCAIDTATGYKLWSAKTDGIVSASAPTVSGGLVFVSSSDDIYCFNASTGNQLWNYTTGGQTSPPVAVDGYVYFGSDDKNVYCLNASSSTILWKYAINEPQITWGSIINGPTLDYSLAVANGVVYTSLSMIFSNSSGENVPVGTMIAIGSANNSAIKLTSPSPSHMALSNQSWELIGFLTVLASALVILVLLFVFRTRKKAVKGQILK